MNSYNYQVTYKMQFQGIDTYSIRQAILRGNSTVPHDHESIEKIVRQLEHSVPWDFQILDIKLMTETDLKQKLNLDPIVDL